MINFDFSTSSRIVFGRGAINQLAGVVSSFGRNVFIVSREGGEIRAKAADYLQSLGLEVHTFEVAGEPTLKLLMDGVSIARQLECDVVVGIGGGSVIDAGKAIAALVRNGGDVLDYLEVVGKNQPILNQPLPYIAIPTTAGTGSEVTRNAVILVEEQKVKVSMRSPMMLPRVSLIDPELLVTLPPAVTASTGMDALTQVIEPYLSIKANPMTDLFCRDGIARIAKSILVAYKTPKNIDAREDMAWGSLMGGLSLANAGLGAVHGIAAPLGGMFQAPHGAICARLLPIVFRVNYEALGNREPENPITERFGEVARWITGNRRASVERGAVWLETLSNAMKIPPFSKYGITTEDIPVIVEKSMASSSMKGNPIKLTEDELTYILEQAL